MRTGIAIVAATLLSCVPLTAVAQVYKCKTAQGTVFSQTPCAADAEEIKVKGMKQSSGSRDRGATAPVTEAPAGATSVDFDEKPPPNTTDELVQLVGKPQAIYYEEDDEYWLYLVGCRAQDRNCPEFRVVGTKIMQVNWHAEDVMRRSVAVASDFSGFTPNRSPVDKSFTFDNAGVQGATRAAVAARLGQPDYKRAFRGIEVWEYRKVRAGGDDARVMTLFLEFEGDAVARVIGN